MDTLKDFLTDLKDRISNPLVSSFVISWCFFNYRIPVALIFYKQNEIHWDKHKSFIDLIDSRQSNWRMIIFPALVAIGYTVLFPFIKAGIKIFNSWLTSATDTNILERTNHHSVPVELHMALLESLTETKERFEKVIKNQSVMIVKNTELENKNREILESSRTTLLEYKETFDKRVEEIERSHSNRLDDENDRYNSEIHILSTTIEDKDKHIAKLDAAIHALANQNQDLRAQIQESANRGMGLDRPR
jgi:hypothetical protein